MFGALEQPAAAITRPPAGRGPRTRSGSRSILTEASTALVATVVFLRSHRVYAGYLIIKSRNEMIMATACSLVYLA
jgi:hypothetical protein